MEKRKYIASFVKRGEKPLSKRRQELFNNLLPKLLITPADLKKLKNQEICLEIGFGAGEHLANQAKNNPCSLFIGSEIFKNGIATLLAKIDDDNISNIRIWKDDARLLLDALPDNSINKIFILFPDPWPKKKHHKRRLISQETLNSLNRVIKKNGLLRIATDHMPYARWTLANFSNRTDFEWEAEKSSDWLEPPKDHYTTRYEEKLKTGDKPIFLNYTKKPK